MIFWSNNFKRWLYWFIGTAEKVQWRLTGEWRRRKIRAEKNRPPRMSTGSTSYRRLDGIEDGGTVARSRKGSG